MLKEIRPEQMGTERENGEVFILMNDTLYTEEEFWDSARILIDYDEDDDWKEVDYEDEDQEDEDEEPEPEDPEPKRRGGARWSKKEEVLAAWNGGERTVDEIVELTGISKQTVKKYVEE